MRNHLMTIVSPCKVMGLGQDIWSCKLHLWSLNATFAFINSYHGGEHYNSVRSKDDACTGPAKPILIKADAGISTTSQEGKTASANSKASGRNIIQQGSIKVVMAGSECEDVEKVKKVLEQVGGDVDAAIEYIIAELRSEEDLDGNKMIRPPPDSGNGDILGEKSKQPETDVHKDKVDHKASRKDEERSKEKKCLLQEEKISGNKSCPCGSKKKYKSCCGSVAGKSYVKLKISGNSGSGNGKNEKKLSKKAGTMNASKHAQSDDDALNMGALCI